MPNTLTKDDIIEMIQMENGYSRKQSTEVTEILLEIIKQSLKSGEDVKRDALKILKYLYN